METRQNETVRPPCAPVGHADDRQPRKRRAGLAPRRGCQTPSTWHPTEREVSLVGFARNGIIRAASPHVGSAAEKKGEAGVQAVEYVVSGEGPNGGGSSRSSNSNPAPAPCGARSTEPCIGALGVLGGCVTNGRVRAFHRLAKGCPRSWLARSGPAMPNLPCRGLGQPVDISA